MKKIFTLLSFLLTFVYVSNATTYYVSSSQGNDANNGTSSSSPWQTINKLNSIFNNLSSGDQVLFNRGDYFYGTILPTKGFAAGNPLVFGAYGSGANPVITGFVTVNSWNNLGGNIWESTSAVSTLNDMNMVVINGVNTPMGRYPNTGWMNVDSHSGNTSVSSSSLGAINWTGADMVMKVNNFNMQRNLITSQSGSTINYNAITPDNANNGCGFFVENDPRTLDVQNEWYYNPSTKKVRIYSASAPVNVQVSTLDTLVYITQKSNFKFDGIDFTGSNRRAFYLGSAANVTIQNCNFNYHGLYAIWGGNDYGAPSSNFNFNHNTVNNVNSKAIDITAEYTNPYIGYNSFKNCGVFYGMFKQPDSRYQFDSPFGTIFCNDGVNGLVVEYNSIDSTGFNGIVFTNQNNARINNNEISHYCLLLMDGGGIYTYSANDAGSNLYNNIVHDGLGDNSGTNDPTEHLAHGIYLDGGTSGNTKNMQVYNNTCFNNPISGIYSNGNSNCNFHNNTCYNNTAAQLQCVSNDVVYSTEANNTLKNNIFVARDPTQLTAKFDTRYSVVDFFALADSNYYARPMDDNITFFIQLNYYTTFIHYTLAQWQSYSNQDLHSHTSPKAITNINDLIFEYNATNVNKTIQLNGNYIDVKNVSYNGAITLAPYTSAVLIRNGAATNQPPVVNAGSDQTITLPTNTVTLSGSATDASGTISSYAWTEISGPSSGPISNTTTPTTTVSALIQGVYQFQLKVADNLGNVASDTVQVTVNSQGGINNLPVVNAGSDQTITLPTNTVTLSGSATDASGTISSYTWTEISGPSSGPISNTTTPTTTVSALIQGVYQFQLKVADNLGNVASDTVQVTVNSVSNLLPAVYPANTVNGIDYSYYEAPSYSSVPADYSTLIPIKVGAASNFDITLANRSTSFSFAFTGYISVPTDGQYTFYTTSDDGSMLYIDNVLVVNNDGLHSAVEQSGTIGLQAGKHSILVGYIQQGGGSVLNVNYSGPGISKQAIPSSALYIISSSPVNQPPVVNAGSDQTITLPTNTVTLSGSATDASGTISSYTWTEISGPSSGPISNTTTPTTTVSALIQGVYQFQLKVADNLGNVASDTVQVTVNSVSNLLPAVYPANTVNGIDYSYYEAPSYSSVPADYSTLIPIKVGAASNFDITLANRSTSFSFAFTGYISVPTDGQYTFYTTSDDGSMLYIDNVLVVNNDGLHSAVEQSGTIGLQAGKHSILVGYIQQGGGSVLNVNYSGPGISKQAIPSSALYIISDAGSLSFNNNNLSISSAHVGIKAYPNPFANYVQIDIGSGISGIYKLTLVDAVGRIVWSRSGTKTSDALQQSINTSGLQRGIYFLNVFQNNINSVIKLVK